MNTWDNLPNAKHIDWVLADVKRNPQKWAEAYDTARDAARDAARGAALDAAWDAARDAARDAALDAVWGRVWIAAWGACTALIAWDYAGDVLRMEPDAVRLLVSAGDHAAVLMLSAVIVKHSKE